MTGFFWVSYVILWLLVLPLVILNLVLFRQLGIMIMGTARGVNESGIAVGKSLPVASTIHIDGSSWSTNELKGSSALMLFGSPTCRECAEILPDFQRLAKLNKVKPVLMLFSSQELASDYVQKIQYEDDVYLVSSEFAHHLDVQVTPFAYAIDSQGVIRHKGLVNSRDQLENYMKSAKVS